MMTLGITGRSGCGKSTVTAVFAARGIPLADADQLSREILLPSSPLLPRLAERFGADIIKEDGTLDRRLLADRAFATPEGKAALDALTHPEIVRRIRAAKQAAQQAGAKLFVLDGAVIIGTAAAIAINNMKRVPRSIVMGITNIPMLNADIVTGISLMLAFIAFGISLGFKTILIAHITFNIPYVILSVMPKLKQTDKSTYEAAMDLGAAPVYAFFKVVFPDILPGVLSGFLLAFTMSLDDFIITHFTRGAGINTLSTLIYSEVRRGIKPSMYALSTIIFLTVLITNFAPKRKKH